MSAIAKGLISDSEAAESLGPLRSELTRIEAELAAAHSHTKVIELHPQAVQRFKENIESRNSGPELALIGSFRSLVETVTVQPRKAGEEYEVSIRGRLAALMGAELSAGHAW